MHASEILKPKALYHVKSWCFPVRKFLQYLPNFFGCYFYLFLSFFLIEFFFEVFQPLCIFVMINPFAPDCRPKLFCLSCIWCFVLLLFSFSIKLTEKPLLIVLENSVLLILIDSTAISLNFANFCRYPLLDLFFYSFSPFCLILYRLSRSFLYLRLIFPFCITVFTLPRSMFSSLTCFSNRLFHETVFLIPTISVTTAAPAYNRSFVADMSLGITFAKTAFTF